MSEKPPLIADGEGAGGGESDGGKREVHILHARALSQKESCADSDQTADAAIYRTKIKFRT